MKKIKLVLKLIIVYILFLVLVYFINMFLNNEVFITKYKVKDNYFIESSKKYKIIQISDIHSIRSVKQKEKIISKIEKESPNIIFITGDLIDSSYYLEEIYRYNKNEVDFPEKYTLSLISELVNITDVYYVYGNHEMMLLDNPEKNILKTKIEEIGVHIINNKIEKLNILDSTVYLLGVQDPATLYKDKKYAYIDTHKKQEETILKDLLKQLKEKKIYTILLSHRPEYFEIYCKYKINIIFSGHAHGGIIRLPIIGGIYAHSQGIFPKYTGGVYKKDNSKMFVNRGIANSNFPMRIFNPPEIICVEISR